MFFGHSSDEYSFSIHSAAADFDKTNGLDRTALNKTEKQKKHLSHNSVRTAGFIAEFTFRVLSAVAPSRVGRKLFRVFDYNLKWFFFSTFKHGHQIIMCNITTGDECPTSFRRAYYGKNIIHAHRS